MSADIGVGWQTKHCGQVHGEGLAVVKRKTVTSKLQVKGQAKESKAHVTKHALDRFYFEGSFRNDSFDGSRSPYFLTVDEQPLRANFSKNGIARIIT
jgi:hypothetical protein